MCLACSRISLPTWGKKCSQQTVFVPRMPALADEVRLMFSKPHASNTPKFCNARTTCTSRHLLLGQAIIMSMNTQQNASYRDLTSVYQEVRGKRFRRSGLRTHCTYARLTLKYQSLLVRCTKHTITGADSTASSTISRPQDHRKDLVRKYACFNNTLNGLNRDSTTASSTSAGADPDLLQDKCPTPTNAHRYILLKVQER